MYKISAFSKLSRVSVKTLRFYDDLGLLKPAVIDENNGYRYYAEEQLLTVKRIIAFKEQGFTLEQIRPLLQENMSPDTVKDHLSMKRTELQRTIEEAQQQLHAIDARLKRVETVKPPPAEGFEVTVRSEPPQLTAAIRDTVPRSKLCLLLDEVRQYVRSFPDAEAGGSLTVIWHGGGSRPEGPVDIEVAVPLQKEIPGNGRVQIGFLPELKLSASLVHHCDPYQQVCSADAVLSSWLASSQIYTLSGTDPIREVYLTPDEDIYGSLRLAELQVPLMPRP